MVLDVRVDTYVGAGEQEVQVSQTVEGDQLIGEMALLSTRPRAVTAKATTAATLLGLEKDMFLQLVDGDLEFTGRISRILSDRIYSTTYAGGRLRSYHPSEARTFVKASKCRSWSPAKRSMRWLAPWSTYPLSHWAAPSGGPP